MPPKKKPATPAPAPAANAAGTKRKRTKAEKLADIKKQHEEERKSKEGKEKVEEKEETDEEEETGETPAKKQKLNPKEEKTPSRRKATASSSKAPAARTKDPPANSTAVAAAQPLMTPPRSAPSQAKKKTSASKTAVMPFNSPKPMPATASRASADNAMITGKDDGDGDNIPLPDFNDKDEAEEKLGLGFRPTMTQDGRPDPDASPAQQQREGELVDPADGNYDDSDDNEDFEDYDSEDDIHTSDDEDRNDSRLERQLEVLQQEGEPQPALAPPPKKPMFSTYTKVLMVLFAVAGYMGYISVPESVIEMFPFLGDFGRSKSIICFYDSPHFQKEEPFKMSELCLDEETLISWQECPSDAYCRGGSLLECPEGFVVDVHGCFLSESSNKTLEAVVNLLQQWTAKDTCKGHPERHEEYGYGSRPLFHYSRVTGELELGYNLGLVKHGNHSRFLLDLSEDGNLWIGLHPKVRVPLTYVCQLKLLFWGVIGVCAFCFGFLFSFAWTCGELYFGALWEEPVVIGSISFFLALVSSLAWKHHTDKCAQQVISRDIDSCHKAVEDILSSDPSKPLTTEELTQKVAWRLYPMSMRARRRVKDIVMGKVTSSMQRDGSIKTIRSTQNGKPLTAWKWVGEPITTIPS